MTHTDVTSVWGPIPGEFQGFGWMVKVFEIWLLRFHFHGPLSKNTRLWLTWGGEGSDTPSLKSVFCSLPNGVVMTYLQVLSGELLAHALHQPWHIPPHFFLFLHSLVWFEQCVHNSNLLRNPLTSGNYCAAQRRGLTIGQHWKGCVEGVLWRKA